MPSPRLGTRYGCPSIRRARPGRMQLQRFSLMKTAVFFLSALSLAGCGSGPNETSDSNTLLISGFETLPGWLPEQQSATLTQERAHTGQTALKVDEAHEYSLTYNNLLGRLRDTRLNKIKVAAWVFLPNSQAAATLVTSVADPATPTAKPLLWEGIKLNEVVKTYGKWVQVSRVMTLPADADASKRLSIYLWRTGVNQPVYIDDLTVSIEP